MKSRSSLGGRAASLRLVHRNRWLVLAVLTFLPQSLAIHGSRGNSWLSVVSLGQSLAIHHVMARHLLTAVLQDCLPHV